MRPQAAYQIALRRCEKLRFFASRELSSTARGQISSKKKKKKIFVEKFFSKNLTPKIFFTEKKKS